MPIQMIIALDINIIICSSMNCPTVICLPTVCYFLERSLQLNRRPRSLSPIILFSDLLFQKSKNTLLHFLLQFNLSQYRGGIDNPSQALGCKYFLFVCRYCLHSVAWFSYRIDNIGFITEGNNYRCHAASSSPLWGNTNTDTSNQEEFFVLLPGRHHQHLSSTYA